MEGYIVRNKHGEMKYGVTFADNGGLIVDDRRDVMPDGTLRWTLEDGDTFTRVKSTEPIENLKEGANASG